MHKTCSYNPVGAIESFVSRRTQILKYAPLEWLMIFCHVNSISKVQYILISKSRKIRREIDMTHKFVDRKIQTIDTYVGR